MTKISYSVIITKIEFSCHSGLDPESIFFSTLDSRRSLSSNVLIGDGNDRNGISSNLSLHDKLYNRGLS